MLALFSLGLTLCCSTRKTILCHLNTWSIVPGFFFYLFCIDLIYLFLWIYLVTIYGSLSVWTFQKLKQ